MGLTAGLLCLVRPINIGFLALFFVDQLYLCWQDSTMHRVEKIQSFVRRSAGFFVAFFLALAPQVVSWYQLNGVPFPARSVGMAGQGLAQFSVMAVLEKSGRIFFSPQWGLVWSMPLALAGVIGLLVSSAKLQSLRYGLLAYVCALFVIVLLYPEDSVSYGKRHFISALPIVAIGLALLWDKLGECRLWKICAFLAVLVCVGAQYIMLVQYKVVLPYNHPQYTWEALSSASQLIRERPDLLLRSTNWLSLLPMEKFWDLKDKLFLVGLPVLQLIAVVGTVFLVNGIRWNVSKRALSLGGILFCLVLSGVVYLAAPTFSHDKIVARKSYQKNMQSGRDFLQQRKFPQALENFKSASVLEPQLLQPLLNAGLALQLDHKNQEAILWFEKALQLVPDDAMTLFNTGKTLAELGDFDRAQVMMQKGIRSQPLFKPAYVFLGEIFLRKNEPGKALQAFQTLLSLNPKDGSSHARLAMVYTVLKETDRAKAHLQEAIVLGGDPGMIRAIQDFYKSQ